MSPCKAAVRKKLPVTGIAVLLLLAGSSFVSGESEPVVLAAQTAEQDSHIIHYQEHLARLQMIHLNCR